jgi:hypothetical protein
LAEPFLGEGLEVSLGKRGRATEAAGLDAFDPEAWGRRGARTGWRINGTTVPEPGSLALLALGLALDRPGRRGPGARGRDAALAAKAREWEESQRQIADARGTITRRADERDAAIVRLNRAANVIAAARALAEYPPKPGEWRALREALAEYDVEVDLEQIWHHYRRDTFAGVIMAVVASQVVGESERSEALFSTMAMRHSRHALDHGALDLI